MGYTTRALVGRTASFGCLRQNFPQAVFVELAQGLLLLSFLDELLDEMTKSKPSDILPPFYYLTKELKVKSFNFIGGESMEYLEVEYSAEKEGKQLSSCRADSGTSLRDQNTKPLTRCFAH
jgi:hypothetical protein